MAHSNFAMSQVSLSTYGIVYHSVYIHKLVYGMSVVPTKTVYLWPQWGVITLQYKKFRRAQHI